jgi:hypothetical protein
MADPLYVYETGLDWVPDDTYINSPQGMVYLAWNIGTDARREKNLWLIQAIGETPTPALGTLLPVGYTQMIFDDDVLKYGHIRISLTKLSVIELQEAFLDELGKIADDQAAGYR